MVAVLGVGNLRVLGFGSHGGWGDRKEEEKDEKG